MCFPSAFNLPSIPRPGQSIERPLSLSLPRYLCIIQHQQWREVYQTSPSVFVSRLSSFFCQKVRLFSLKRCHCCLHLLIFFFCMILPHNYEINIIMDLNFHVYSLWFPWTGPCCDCKFTCHWKQSLNEKPKWSSEKYVSKTTIFSTKFRRRRRRHHHF